MSKEEMSIELSFDKEKSIVLKKMLDRISMKNIREMYERIVKPASPEELDAFQDFYFALERGLK